MKEIELVLDGHLLQGPGSTGVNAYLYRRDALTNEIVLARKLETLRPGGNRVLAALEVIAPHTLHMDRLLDTIQQTRLTDGEHVIGEAIIRVSRYFSEAVEEESILSIVKAFRALFCNEQMVTPLLVFERSHEGDTTVYALSDTSRQHLEKTSPGTKPVPVRISQDVRTLFEATHGPFEQHFVLAALSGLNWQQLAELGGYTVMEKGREVYRWPIFDIVK